jgi:uncharacterized membrane protein YphA (DoxX/SURF4 family)
MTFRRIARSFPLSFVIGVVELVGGALLIAGILVRPATLLWVWWPARSASG